MLIDSCKNLSNIRNPTSLLPPLKGVSDAPYLSTFAIGLRLVPLTRPPPKTPGGGVCRPVNSGVRRPVFSRLVSGRLRCTSKYLFFGIQIQALRLAMNTFVSFVLKLSSGMPIDMSMLPPDGHRFSSRGMKGIGSTQCQ